MQASVVPAIAAFWERVRASARLKGAFLFAVVMLVGLGSSLLPSPAESALAGAERVAYDWQMRLLRTFYPRPVANDVVIVGIDEQTESVFTEPIALWHPHFAAHRPDRLAWFPGIRPQADLGARAAAPDARPR